MRFSLTKMHALGNDYIVISAFRYPSLLSRARSLARTLSDRHFGVGGDGIIFACPSKKADLRMRMFNADGSEAEMCGNGVRQLALYAFQEKICRKTRMTIETGAGIKSIQLERRKGGGVTSITVNMGRPILDPALIPAVADANDGGYAVKNLMVEDRSFDFTLVSMGNPHAVAFVEDIESFPVQKYGRPVEDFADVFPNRTNVEFVQILSRSNIFMRVWERGSGETLACGTGACASVAAGFLNGLTDRKVLVHLLGGDLKVEWSEDGDVLMTGNAVRVFDATLDADALKKSER